MLRVGHTACSRTRSRPCRCGHHPCIRSDRRRTRSLPLCWCRSRWPHTARYARRIRRCLRSSSRHRGSRRGRHRTGSRRRRCLTEPEDCIARWLPRTRRCPCRSAHRRGSHLDTDRSCSCPENSRRSRANRKRDRVRCIRRSRDNPSNRRRCIPKDQPPQS